MSTQVEPRPVKVAVLGVGMSARVFHIPLILSLPSFFSLHAIWERSATKERSVARDLYGSTGVKVVSVFEDVLADPDVDLVVVSTPNDTHYPYAKASNPVPHYINPLSFQNAPIFLTNTGNSFCVGGA